MERLRNCSKLKETKKHNILVQYMVLNRTFLAIKDTTDKCQSFKRI